MRFQFVCSVIVVSVVCVFGVPGVWLFRVIMFSLPSGNRPMEYVGGSGHGVRVSLIRQLLL